ncbi:MAG: ribonuclease HII [Leptonema sp. (in: bacteria)]
MLRNQEFPLPVQNLSKFELSSYKNFELVLGVDEAGRGSIAGPVSISYVGFSNKYLQNIVNKKNFNFETKIRDSKQLKEKEREFLLLQIQNFCLVYKNLLVSSLIVDKLGINGAIEKAIIIFLKHLILYNSFTKIKIYLDGNYNFSYQNLVQEIPKIQKFHILRNNSICDIVFIQNTKIYKIQIENVPKGDEKVFSIACASIVSKVLRDQYMKNLSNRFPIYEFHIHKGYGTKKHRMYIETFGNCILHRKSFIKFLT